MKEFILAPGNMWIVLVFVLVCLDLFVLHRMYLTLVAVAAFLAGFFARLFMPFPGQVATFVLVGLFLLWKGRKPVERWREKTLAERKKARAFAETLDPTVVDAIPGPTLPGKILVKGIVLPARAHRSIREGTPVKITSSGPAEIWVKPR